MNTAKSLRDFLANFPDDTQVLMHNHDDTDEYVEVTAHERPMGVTVGGNYLAQRVIILKQESDPDQ